MCRPCVVLCGNGLITLFLFCVLRQSPVALLSSNFLLREFMFSVSVSVFSLHCVLPSRPTFPVTTVLCNSFCYLYCGRHSYEMSERSWIKNRRIKGIKSHLCSLSFHSVCDRVQAFFPRLSSPVLACKRRLSYVDGRTARSYTYTKHLHAHAFAEAIPLQTWAVLIRRSKRINAMFISQFTHET